MNDRIKSLDGVRGIACVGIAFFSHYWKFWQELFPYITSHLPPELLVEVFVAISRFCLVHKYGSGIKEGFILFWIKRYLKIMPLFWITVTIMIVFDWFSSQSRWITFPIALSMWKQFVGLSAGLFTKEGHANGALWTIDVLLVCYAYFYCINWVKNKFVVGKTIYYIVNFSVTLFSFYGSINRWEKPFLYYTMSLRVYASFSIGMLLYEVYKVKPPHKLFVILG